MAYTFDFIDRDGRVDHFDFGEFSDDELAERAARNALKDSRTAICIQVWEGERQVARIESALSSQN